MTLLLPSLYGQNSPCTIKLKGKVLKSNVNYTINSTFWPLKKGPNFKAL